jgi:2,3-bisphosphoglycerate-independent phosphoglycerate mutase
MKAAEIVDATLSALQTGQYKHARINLPNGDMVGHTGNFDAAVMACEIVDLTLGKLLRGIAHLGGAALITADHGNCEQMFETDKNTGVILCDESGRPKPKTSHTLCPVPLSFFDPQRQRPGGLKTESTDVGLANVPATILDLLGFSAPSDYKPSLLKG